MQACSCRRPSSQSLWAPPRPATHACAPTQKHAHAQTRAQTHLKDTHIHTHTQMHAHRYRHTQTRTHVRACGHTHTLGCDARTWPRAACRASWCSRPCGGPGLLLRLLLRPLRGQGPRPRSAARGGAHCGGTPCGAQAGCGCTHACVCVCLHLLSALLVLWEARCFGPWLRSKLCSKREQLKTRHRWHQRQLQPTKADNQCTCKHAHMHTRVSVHTCTGTGAHTSRAAGCPAQGHTPLVRQVVQTGAHTCRAAGCPAQGHTPVQHRSTHLSCGRLSSTSIMSTYVCSQTGSGPQVACSSALPWATRYLQHMRGALGACVRRVACSVQEGLGCVH